MDQAGYLSDPSFSEAHTGPLVYDPYTRQYRRDPDVVQVWKMAAAIRRAYPRQMAGESSAALELQVVGEDVFGVRSVDVFR